MFMNDKLIEIIEQSNNIVFLGGAGVSTESGIPDFRSDKGVFKALQKYGYPPEKLLSHTFFKTYPELFFDFHKKMMLYPGAKPNKAHFALAKLEKSGKLKAIITQNTDGLHQMAGSVNVLELHGSVTRNYCIDCNAPYDMEYVMHSPDMIPKCQACGGIVRPDVVIYEEALDVDVVSKAKFAIENADVLIVGGTSLVVYPAAGLVNYYRGNKLVLINKSETPYDEKANLVIHESIGKILGHAVGIV